MKKLVSLLLAALMICAMLSLTAFAVMGEGSPSDIGEQNEQGEIASSLSEGNLLIVVGISCAVAFGLGGFFIEKTVGKNPTPASDAENEKEI